MKPLDKQLALTDDNIPYPSEPRHAGQVWTREHSRRHGVTDFGPSLTKQSEAEGCDINLIIARYGIPPNLESGLYGDFSDSASFLEAQNIISHANQQFMGLDASLRKRFSNDPAEFLAFMENPENGDEMVKLGLATRKDVEGGQPAPDKTSQAASSTALKTKKVVPPAGGTKAAQTAGEAE